MSASRRVEGGRRGGRFRARAEHLEDGHCAGANWAGAAHACRPAALYNRSMLQPAPPRTRPSLIGGG